MGVYVLSEMHHPRASPSTSFVHKHRLHVAVLLQAVGSPLDTDATLLVSAKWHQRVDLKVPVDPDGSGFEIAAELLGFLDVLGPDGGAEAHG